MASKPNHYIRQNTEVSFAQHSYEFVRFYSNHESLNVEIAGIKVKKYFEKGVEKEFVINKHNFSFGIKKLQAFIIDNLHYINRRRDVENLLTSAYELEEDFNYDEEYSRYVRKQNLSAEEHLKFNIRYFEYLLRCFNLSNKLNALMQNTLMISPKMQKKEIMYRDDSPFFDNLSNYRDGISNNLANFKMISILDHFKYVLSYYYTYSSLIDDEFKVTFNRIIEGLKDEILSKRTIEYILALSKGEVSASKEREIREYSNQIKKALHLFYYYCNVILREKNIFPNNVKKISVDLIRNI